MATSSEKRALIFIAALAALGVTVRAFRSGRADREDTSAALDRQIAAVDSAVEGRGRRGNARGRSGASRRGPRADSERVSAWTDDPPVRAERPRAPAAVDAAEARRREVAEANRGAQQRLDELNSVITVTPNLSRSRSVTGSPPPSPSRDPALGTVDIDTADETTIATVPWIGPSLAARIVRDRTHRGTFGSLDGLQRVAGVGPGLVARIASRVRFSGPGMGPPKVTRFRKVRP
jgi:DNA uptake protein ComE-like DNA-binding protein